MAASYKIVYWKGLRCYHSLREGFDPQEGGQVGTGIGVTRLYGTRVADSPNFEWEISVPCWWDPATTLITDLDDQSTFIVQSLQVKRDFIAACGELGPLSICPDDQQYASVSTSYAAGLRNVIMTGAPGGSWTPAAGRYVLVRDPSSGEGFVTQIVGWTGGTNTMAIMLPVAITSSWQVRNIILHFDNAQYLGSNLGASPSPMDNYRPNVIYRFGCSEAPLIASALLSDLS